MRKRNRVAFVTGLLGISVLLAVHLSAQSADPWLGKWKANLQKSAANGSTNSPPKSISVTLEPWNGGERSTSDTVTATGQLIHRELQYKFDGKDNAVKGALEANTTWAYRRVDNHTYEYVVKVDGKVTGTTRGAVSRDGKTLITTSRNAQGQPGAIAVFDKQ